MTLREKVQQLFKVEPTEQQLLELEGFFDEERMISREETAACEVFVSNTSPIFRNEMHRLIERWRAASAQR